jgi:hypothetical protein
MACHAKTEPRKPISDRRDYMTRIQEEEKGAGSSLPPLAHRGVRHRR